jgi:O-antigen/teichoic acid export membrane protein
LLSVWINNQLDRMVLLAYVGLAGVGVFGAANRIVALVAFLLAVFQAAWTPYSMIIIKSKERDEVYRRTFRYYIGAFAALGLAMTAFCPEVFAFVLPAQYGQGYLIVPWLIGAAVLHDTSIFTRLGMLVSEKTGGISAASWIGVILNVVIAIPLIRAFGFSGAAIGFFVAELTFTSLLWRFSARQSVVHLNSRRAVFVLLIYVVASILMLLLASRIPNPMSSVCRLGVLLGAVGLIGVQTVDDLVRQFFKSMRDRTIAIFWRSEKTTP